MLENTSILCFFVVNVVFAKKRMVPPAWTIREEYHNEIFM